MEISFLGTLSTSVFWVYLLTQWVPINLLNYTGNSERQAPGCFNILSTVIISYVSGIACTVWMIMFGIKVSWLMFFYIVVWGIIFALPALFLIRPILMKILPSYIAYTIRNIVSVIGTIMLFKMLP
jgi:hypothetical protein